MRRRVFVATRTYLVAVLALSLLNLPAMAGSESPLGVVLTADRARLDNASAIIGANVFPGDVLVTESGGSLRLTVGPSQVYLLSSASASLVPHDGKVQARVNRGTVGFSSPVPAKLEVQTPLGVIRGADAQPIFGQVSVMSPGKMRVSSFRGTLLVTDTAGGKKTINAGETFEASLTPEPSADNNPPAEGSGTGGHGIPWKTVEEVAVPLIIGGVVACLLWPESPSGMGCAS